MERGVAQAAPRIDVGARVDHRLDDRGMVGARRPREHPPLKQLIAALGVGPGGEATADGVGIAGEHLGDRRLGPGRADGKPLQHSVERADRGHREQKRHGDPREPLLEQAPQAPAAIHEHREVAAEQEEQRHAEAVDGKTHEREQADRLRVMHGPWTLIECDAHVHDDPEGHRECAEGVEIVAALGHGEAPVGLACLTAPNRLCCRELLAPGKA